jgi:hypothetical protein
MRRCGRLSCFFGTGVLVATLFAGGAFAAPGGNGKSHQANGLALAKGHAKHAAAAPQPSPEPAKPDEIATPHTAAAKPKGAAPRQTATKPGRGAERRAEHLTICHRTGSGRYIVISPSVTGATNGHLKHHDDFVYHGSCVPSRPVPTPTPPGGTPGSAGDPPSASDPPSNSDPTSTRPNFPEAGGPTPGTVRELPFTGFPVVPTLLAGFALLGTGLVLRRKPAR